MSRGPGLGLPPYYISVAAAHTSSVSVTSHRIAVLLAGDAGDSYLWVGLKGLMDDESFHFRPQR